MASSIPSSGTTAPPSFPLFPFVMTNQDHALQNAQAWAEEITTLYEAFAFCEASAFCADELMEAREISLEARQMLSYDGGNREECLETIKDHCRESILSGEVRFSWHVPGEMPDYPDEFQILLTTGGPALRIRGDLDRHGEPRRAWLECQDWFTPWREVRCCDSEVLLWFAGLFYYGEY